MAAEVTTDIASWLLERIAEDERMAAALQTAPASVPEWEYRPNGRPHPGVYEQGRIYAVLNDEHSDEMLAYVANWDPARVLAECEAKRKIIQLHARTGGLRDPRRHAPTFDYSVDTCEACRAEWPFDEVGEDYPDALVSDGKRWGYLDVWKDENSHPTLWPCLSLRLPASPYADLPGYRSEWAP